jgi:sporulation protein YlmC with PRC-barrel domain
MRKALLAAAAIAALASTSAMAQTTTTDNPQNGTSADKMSPTGTPGMGANPTTMAPANAPQTATQPVPKDGPNFTKVQNTDMLSSNVVGLDIYNSENDDIGKVQDIAFDASKKVTGYILSVGGFLGMGTRYVTVNPDVLMVSYDAQNKTWKATMNATKDQLKAAPEFKYAGQWTASKS